MTHDLQLGLNIARQHQIYRAATALSPELLLIVRDDATIFDCSESFANVLGYTREHLQDRLFMDFVVSDDEPDGRNNLSETIQEFKALRDSREVMTNEFINHYRHKDGHIITFCWTVANVYVAGCRVAYCKELKRVA